MRNLGLAALLVAMMIFTFPGVASATFINVVTDEYSHLTTVIDLQGGGYPSGIDVWATVSRGEAEHTGMFKFDYKVANPAVSTRGVKQFRVWREGYDMVDGSIVSPNIWTIHEQDGWLTWNCPHWEEQEYIMPGNQKEFSVQFYASEYGYVPAMVIGGIPQLEALGETKGPAGAASVPEPSTLLLLGIGLVGLVGSRRKFRT